MLLILTWAAGCVDAISYLGLGHVFTAMMTGNTVLLGLALAQGEILAALRSIVALIGFAAGVAAGAMIVERDDKDRRWPRAVTKALALEAVFLAVFVLTWHFAGNSRGAAAVYFLIVLLSLAMGLQAAAVRRLGVPGIATTYITGTMTSLMVDLVGWIRSAASPPRPAGIEGNKNNESSGVPWEQRVGLLAGVFFLYGFGALAGGVLYTRAPMLAALSPLIAVGAVVMNASVRYRR
ncbi:MAG: YoaK family protein [Candidatus Binatia bacterium]